MARRNIKTFYGKIIGSVEDDTRNNIIAKDKYGKILGRFDKTQNVTKDAYGKIIGTGDLTSALIWQAFNEEEARLKATITTPNPKPNNNNNNSK